MTPERLQYLLSSTTYLHLTSGESALARAWLREHAAEWDDVYFDVNLGQGVDLGDSFDDTTRAQAAYLTQKRADMIAQRGTVYNVVEIKQRIDFQALGQLLGYKTLLYVDHPDATEVELTVIGWSATADAVEVLHAHGVNVQTYTAPLNIQAKVKAKA